MKKRIIVILVVFVMIIVVGLIIINNNRRMEDDTYKNKTTIQEHNTAVEEKTLYNTIYYFESGSRRVKINENGDVFDDIEVEEPNHIVNYKFLKTLSEEQLNSLKSKLQSTSNKGELDEFVIELVYGVKQFDKFGRY